MKKCRKVKSQLQEQYDAIAKIKKADLWGEYPYFLRTDWRDEVAAQDTHLGYWDWVIHQLESAHDDWDTDNTFVEWLQKNHT